MEISGLGDSFVSRVGGRSLSLPSMSFCLLILVYGTMTSQNGGMLAAAPPGIQSRIEATVVDFERDVFPIFSRACLECHGEKSQEGGLRLDVQRDFLDSGVINASAPDTSELMRRITLPRGHDEVMPVVGEPLLAREVEVIRRWIIQGAPWPANFTPPPHWAYVAPKRPPLPYVSDQNWVKSPLDRFVLASLEDRSWRPSSQAAPATLLRRVYLDLIGLPPTPQAIADFVADPSPVAYESVVDDLLTRPQFGERWARHWLDLARYADSHGFQRDNLHDLWAYRDWVIQAMNEDMPYDQFTLEQLAGDLLPHATESQRIATGFHRCSPINVEAGAIPEETRIEQVMDRVNTTATVWLGSTLECAQCHDHKYDPFTTKDYYQLLAFFNSTELEADRNNPKAASSIAFLGPSMPLSDPVIDAKREELQKRIEPLLADQQQIQRKIDENLPQLAADLASATEDVSRPKPQLQVVAFSSQGTTDSYDIRDDGSVLLVGNDPPEKDVYTITAKVKGSDIRYIRLDALTDQALPGTGPGRGDPLRSNFVLNDFAASIGNGKDAHALKFVNATSDFTQNKWDASGAIDDSLATGWAIAPRFGKSHWATFELIEPIDAPEEIELTFVLTQQFGQARTIGCLQLTALSRDSTNTSVPEKILSLARQEPTTWNDQERKMLIDHFQNQNPKFLQIEKKILALQKDLNALQQDTTLVMIELDQPRSSTVLMRGDYRSPGETVSANTPEWLHPLVEDSQGVDPPNRLTLARWLVDPANPLVARTAVNRWWSEIFGEGLVRTPEDFGIKGERPTHPQLLDWLAVELIENGWSMKHIIKTIALSATYQQSSATTPELIERDDQNRWLSRGPRHRMNAEMIRDHALAVSGLLSLKHFGPPIRPYQPDGIWSKVGGTNYEYDVSRGAEAYRRGIYVIIKRGSPYPSFINFDANNRFACTVSRSRSNTPLQALTLLNDRVYVEAAQAIALRAMQSTEHQSIESTLRHEFLSCTSRPPDESELKSLSSLYQKQRIAAESDPQSVSDLLPGQDAPFFASIDQADKLMPKLTPESASDFSAWYSVATVLLNLHETITKE